MPVVDVASELVGCSDRVLEEERSALAERIEQPA
jgi:hypothetical protein